MKVVMATLLALLFILIVAAWISLVLIAPVVGVVTILLGMFAFLVRLMYALLYEIL